MPRKVFTAGEVLAAADVNEFLMDQTIQSFAGTAARGSAIPSPVEGMAAYLNDSNLVSIYDGSAWKNSVGVIGGVIQAVYAKTSTVVANTTTSYVDTGLTATITPKSSTSRILVLVTQNGITRGSLSTSAGVNVRILYPNGTGEAFATALGFTATGISLYTAASFDGTYTPNSLSAQTFKTQFHSISAGQRVAVQEDSNQSSSMILLEVEN
jgi:hypothetical protein